ncbi:uncharacterized protein SCHCODRAFT_02248531 [Schizophyllum commune H4-8]|uniref:uncharacterized protein n=1 Tax=Schizophyllum commune (strain H4-8 / FGSC 9210) TaxID=578458 RepID=UPI0021604CC6|nr:uncharacterized protein SCHCODRAFT_02248531 [Schizophyllum commune H4-8]KAI5893262.1 hypothetical protein SCHCODRAFT_02248531 [Schizophyllum commune H4-8]
MRVSLQAASLTKIQRNHVKCAEVRALSSRRALRRSHLIQYYASTSSLAFLRPSRRVHGRYPRTSHGLRCSSPQGRPRACSEAIDLRPASKGFPSPPSPLPIPFFPLRLPPPLGDEYTYRRPPSEDPFPFPSPSPPPSALDCATLLVLTLATLFELAAPHATPSILISTDFNTPRGLGADAHVSGSTCGTCSLSTFSRDS